MDPVRWWKLADPKRLQLPVGKSADVRFLLPRTPLTDRIQFALSEPPDGITIQSASPGRDGVDIVLQADAARDLWNNGAIQRADGYHPEESDFAADGTHHAGPGIDKMGALLLQFFKTDSTARPWFVRQ